MSSILSAISGQFSKSLILGTFLPVVVFIILGMIFVVPLLPPDLAVITQLKGIENLEPSKLIILTFLAVVLSGLIYNLNIPIMRLYEGYPWRKSLPGRWMTRRYQKQFDALNAREEGMRVVRDELRSGPNPALLPGFEERLNRVSHRIHNEFPDRRTLILPTRFGNVIRSFEVYSRRQYGIESITLWPRLVAKIDKDYAAVIDDSKTSFSFMMNGSLLSVLFAALVLTLGLIYPERFGGWGSRAPWLLEVAAFALASYLMYVGATNRAAAWGATVKSAFDLYRWDLLKQMGYERTPTTVADEQTLWSNISTFLIYGPPPQQRARSVQYKIATTAALDQTPRMMLDIMRGVSDTVTTDGELTIKIKVTNTDKKKPAKGVVVTDALPDGYDYSWGSETVDVGGVSVVGANPYRFNLGEIPADGSRILEYRMLLRKKP